MLTNHIIITSKYLKAKLYQWTILIDILQYLFINLKILTINMINIHNLKTNLFIHSDEVI